MSYHDVSDREREEVPPCPSNYCDCPDCTDCRREQIELDAAAEADWLLEQQRTT